MLNLLKTLLTSLNLRLSVRKKPFRKLERKCLTKVDLLPDRKKTKDIQFLKTFHRKITLVHLSKAWTK